MADFWSQFEPDPNAVDVQLPLGNYQDTMRPMLPSSNTGISGYGSGGMAGGIASQPTEDRIRLGLPWEVTGMGNLLPPSGDTYNPIGGPGDNRAYMWIHPELWTQDWTGPRPDGGTGPITRTDRQAQIGMSGGVSSTVGGPTSGTVTMQAFNDAWLQSPYPGTVDGLKQFMAAHPEYAAAGITLGGSKGDKVYGPGGAFWGDAVIAAGEGGRGKSGMTGDTGGGGAGSPMGSLGYSFGSSMAPWNEQFSAPTAEQALDSPGFQFAMDQGLKGIQGSAAAKGTLLSGGTLKGLQSYGQGLALQNYGDLYNRNMGEYLLRRENFYGNQDRPFSKNLSLAQLGKPG